MSLSRKAEVGVFRSTTVLLILPVRRQSHTSSETRCTVSATVKQPATNPHFFALKKAISSGIPRSLMLHPLKSVCISLRPPGKKQSEVRRRNIGPPRGGGGGRRGLYQYLHAAEAYVKEPTSPLRPTLLTVPQ